MPPRAASATAPAIAPPALPVTASLCWRAGAGVADGVGVGTGVADGVVLGVGAVVGVGLGVGVTDGLGADGLGLGDADGAGVGVTGVDVDGLGVGVGLGDADGVTDGAGVGLGLGSGVGTGGVLGSGSGVGAGVGVGVGVNPALPPDSRRTTRVLTSQDLSWEVMVAESLHGPGSAASTPTFSWSRAFSPVLSVTLSVALLLSQLTTVGSWNRSYIGWPQGPAEWYTPTRPTSRSLHTNC